MAAAPSQAYVSLCQYVSKVANEVRDRLMQRKVPSPDQLLSYVKQVVEQLHKLTKGAPRNVQDQLAEPWDGLYDYFNNKPLSTGKMTAQTFLGILESLEISFKVPAAGGAAAPAAAAAPTRATAPAAPSVRTGGAALEASGGYPQASAGGAPRAPNPAPAAAAGAVRQQALFEKPKVVKPAGAAGGVQAASAGGTSGMRADAAEFTPGGPSTEATKTRRSAAPPISDASKRLPTYEKKDFIVAAIRRNTVTVISGDTGCGKSTLIPQLVCDAENLVPDDKVVVCTQPRRVAAITLAEYVAHDRQQELGDECGYQIRFINKFTESTRLIYATTAIVLRRLHSESELDSIGCLIIDEVHERDVYTDFLLLLIRQAMLNGRMPHMKIVLMSATLKADDFAQYFKQINGDMALKPVHIQGRMFPVQDYYWEDACEWCMYCPAEKSKGKGKGKKGKDSGGGGVGLDDINNVYEWIKKDNTPKDRPGKIRCNDFSEKSLKACCLWKPCEVYLDLVEDLVHYFHREMPQGDGAILIFLPGWGDIVKTYIRLFQTGENFKLITLHSLMTPEQQHEAFERPPKGMRKIVLSTNIAEASVTIDDIVYVIDTGVRKERTFDAGTGISSLDTKMVTKANAIQRRGRAGRCQEGLVVHMFPSYKFETLDQFPIPQMLSSSMEEVVLQSKVIHGGSNSEITDMLTNSMAAPSGEAIQSAVLLLKGMNCLTREGELTVLGRAVAAIPVQPNVAKFLLIAAAFRVIKPAACIAAFLSIKSPFQQTVETDKADSSKKVGKDYFNKGYASDHLTMLQAYVEWRQQVARGNADEFCDQQGLSPETLDMACMMVNQFVSFMVDAGYDGEDVNQGNYEDVDPVRKGSTEDALVRAAMVAGFMPNVCCLYRGNRSPYWYLDSNEEVSPFRGSANADYQMSSQAQDGDEWMIFSDSMKMGRFNSIMDSSLVFSPFVLLFANALMVNEAKGQIRFDKWYAYIDTKGGWLKELLQLRKEVMKTFKESIEARDLSAFPMDLVQRIASFCRQVPIKLTQIEAVQRSIDEEVSGAQRDKLSIFEWPYDEGPGDEEEEEEEDQ